MKEHRDIEVIKRKSGEMDEVMGIWTVCQDLVKHYGI